MRFRESLKEFFFIRKITVRFLCKPQKITKGYKRVTICYCLLLILGIWSGVILPGFWSGFAWVLPGFCLFFCLGFAWLFCLVFCLSLCPVFASFLLSFCGPVSTWRSPLCCLPGGAPFFCLIEPIDLAMEMCILFPFQCPFGMHFVKEMHTRYWF